MISQPDGLISVLLDRSAREDERDDAAMDLSLFSSDKVLNALYTVAIDENEDAMILDSCGESLANIWVKRNEIDKEKIRRLSEIAFFSAKQFIKGNKPEWLIYFEIE